MTFVIQDFLDYSQIKADKFRTILKPFNVCQAVEKVMEIQRHKAKEMNIDFTCHFRNIKAKGAIQVGEFSPIIVSDEMRLQQVLLNIQANALKFTEKGSVRIEVEIVKVVMDHYLQVSVIDTGMGIKEEDKSKLFKLFGFVKDSKNLNSNGIGLGLMISDMIVTKYNGKITFDSTFGQGSTFSFTFKIDIDPNDPFETHALLPEKE